MARLTAAAPDNELLDYYLSYGTPVEETTEDRAWTAPPPEHRRAPAERVPPAPPWRSDHHDHYDHHHRSDHRAHVAHTVDRSTPPPRTATDRARADRSGPGRAESVAASLRPYLVAIETRLIDLAAAHAVRLMKLAIGVIFVWFGVLKLVPGLSPAEGLVMATLDELFALTHLGFIPHRLAFLLLATWEVGIGFCFLADRHRSATLANLMVHMASTTTPLFLLPEAVWTHFPYALTLEGQYIVKNLVVVAGGAAIAASLPHPSAEPTDDDGTLDPDWDPDGRWYDEEWQDGDAWQDGEWQDGDAWRDDQWRSDEQWHDPDAWNGDDGWQADEPWSAEAADGVDAGGPMAREDGGVTGADERNRTGEPQTWSTAPKMWVVDETGSLLASYDLDGYYRDDDVRRYPLEWRYRPECA